MPGRDLRVAVIGAAGYVGGETLRLLHQHPRVGSIAAVSRSQPGKPLAQVHPALAHVAAATFVDRFDGADVVFFALGHGESTRELPGWLAGGDPIVVDLAQDFRLDPAWVYALCDPPGLAIAGKRRIAAPGCFATATQLALYPIATRLAEVPSCYAITGSSGAGAAPKRTTHHPVRAHNLFAYGLEGHRHEAEIAAQLTRWAGRPSSCVLLPHSGPFVRGIHATIRARVAEPLADPLALYREAYAGRPFVRVTDAPPELSAVVGTNFAHVHAVARDGGREVIATCVIDNLVKGAAGQAIQAMNLALGFPETEGLAFPGVYPC
jgi:N-acetyl-gamma-glutamyl-phosphate reductase